MVKTPIQAMMRLAGFALVCLAVVSAVYFGVRPTIAEQTTKALLSNFQQLTPDYPLDARLLDQAQEITLANGLPVTVYDAVDDDGQLLAHFVRAVTMKGYNGEIAILIGIAPDNHTLLGVRTLAHRETPGLGDKIDLRISDWILGFTGKSLDSAQFKVKKDGGDFDAFTGATITPRALTNLVGEVLENWPLDELTGETHVP